MKSRTGRGYRGAGQRRGEFGGRKPGGLLIPVPPGDLEHALIQQRRIGYAGFPAAHALDAVADVEQAEQARPEDPDRKDRLR